MHQSDRRWRRQSLCIWCSKTISHNFQGAFREARVCSRAYSEIFGLGERLGCILNLGHSFDVIGAYL